MRMRSERLAILLVAGLLVASCSPSPSGSTSGSASITGAATPTPPPVISTSETLIAAALASGAITYEQSLHYRALALFDSDRKSVV